MNTAKRRNWIFCIIVGLLSCALAWLPSPSVLGGSLAPRAKVRVLWVDNTLLQPLGVVYSGVQDAEVEILSGAHKGEIAIARNHLNSALDKDKLFAPGDVALAMVSGKDGRLTAVTLIDHYRLDTQALLFGLFGVLLIGFAGVSGCGALVSLVASVMIVWKLLIPLLMAGYSPIGCALLMVVLLTALIDVLVAGFTWVSLVAILGSLLGTAITCALAVLFGHWLKLDGGSLPYVVPIITQSNMTLNLREIFFAMVFISNSGALMDLSMDIASACHELIRHKPDITPQELLKSAFSIGRNVIGTMTTTLMLAYSGSYLSLLMYFSGQGTPVMDILNLKYVSSEVLITLVGSFGLVSVAPFTAVVASLCRRGSLLAQAKG